jgi:hypothetical protein
MRRQSWVAMLHILVSAKPPCFAQLQGG